MRQNPFSSKHPAEPRFFANRTEILLAGARAIERSLNAVPPKPDNLAITGKWGYGKTSLLRKLEAIALQNPRVFTAYIELTPSSCADFGEFAKRVRDDVERGFRTSNLPLVAKLKDRLLPDWRIKTIELGIGIGLERGQTEKSQVTVFEDAFRELWKILKANGIRLAVLMFDDLNYLAQGYPAGLYDLRGIFQRLAMEGCNFMLVITGPSSRFQMREFAEPFARFFERHELGLFGPEETRSAINTPLRLVKSGIRVDDAVITRIYGATRGHPYFIHFVMHALVDSCEGGRISTAFYREHYPSISSSLAKDKFEYDFLTKASGGERAVLLAMAKAKGEEISPSQIRAPNARKFLRLLAEKGLVSQSTRGKYSLYHPLFRDFLTGREGA